jgi:hypothetical protein
VCYLFFDILRLESNSINILLQLNNFTFCFQIAGGSGITPMLQVVRAILKNPDDNTQVSCDKNSANFLMSIFSCISLMIPNLGEKVLLYCLA